MNKFARRIVTATAAAALSIGILGFTAPAEAKDSSWGYSVSDEGTSKGGTKSYRDSSWGY